MSLTRHCQYFIMISSKNVKLKKSLQKLTFNAGFFLYTKEGDIVMDLFGGSGSTIIAAEQLNRKCYTMELDPKYCDVMVKRWETLTNKEAILEQR